MFRMVYLIISGGFFFCNEKNLFTLWSGGEDSNKPPFPWDGTHWSCISVLVNHVDSCFGSSALVVKLDSCLALVVPSIIFWGDGIWNKRNVCYCAFSKNMESDFFKKAISIVGLLDRSIICVRYIMYMLCSLLQSPEWSVLLLRFENKSSYVFCWWTMSVHC